MRYRQAKKMIKGDLGEHYCRVPCPPRHRQRRIRPHQFQRYADRLMRPEVKAGRAFIRETPLTIKVYG